MTDADNAANKKVHTTGETFSTTLRVIRRLGTPSGTPSGHHRETGHLRATAEHRSRGTCVLISLWQRRDHFSRPPMQLRLADFSAISLANLRCMRSARKDAAGYAQRQQQAPAASCNLHKNDDMERGLVVKQIEKISDYVWENTGHEQEAMVSQNTRDEGGRCTKDWVSTVAIDYYPKGAPGTYAAMITKEKPTSQEPSAACESIPSVVF